VFAAAFLAGAAAAVGLNRTLDVHLAQRQPRVESEPIFVALRSLPQGTPLTVWDVALREWPKAMLPAAALRPRDAFDGMVLKHPIREGQPILSVQLAKITAPRVDSQMVEAKTAPATTTPSSGVTSSEQTDLWAPAAVSAPATPPTEIFSEAGPPVRGADTVAVAAADAVADAVSLPTPVVSEPVVVAVAPATDIDPVPPPTAEPAGAPARGTVMRYLVVPERIALEADRSFVPPADEEQRRDAEAGPGADAIARMPAGQAPSPAVQPPVQQPRPATRTSSNRYRQPQRPPRPAVGPAAATKKHY
jgi:hypothetical protein